MEKSSLINKEHNEISRYWFIPVIIVVTVVPLILMIHEFDTGLSGHAWFGNEKVSYDVYLYYKALAIKTCGAIVAVISIGLYIKNKPSFLYERPSAFPMTALTVYSVFTVFSSVMAVVPWDASFGGINRFEGCYVILSYVFFFYMVFGYARSLKLIRFLLDSILIGSTVFSFIGVLETFGVNIYDWDWFVSMLYMIEPNDTLEYNVEAYNIVSSTLDNPNYVGSYVALLLPFSMYLLLRGEKLWRRILAGITFLELGIFLYGSESDTGLVAIFAGVFVALFFLFPEFKKWSKIALVSVGVIGIAFILVVLFSGEFYKNFFVGRFVSNIENIETNYNSITISTSDDKKIRVTMDKVKGAKEGWNKKYSISELLSITDENTGKNLSVDVQSDVREKIVENGYPSLSFCTGQLRIPKDKSLTGKEIVQDVLYMEDGEFELKFGTILGSNLCYYKDETTRVLLRNVDRIGFDGFYSFANGRGYIWACTIPLLKDYLIIGAGQDNYIHVFPNDDYVGKVYYGYESMYLTKPHNTFLGIWVQQGLIALIAYLFLYGLFMIRVIRLCYGKKKIASSEGFSAKGVAITTAIATTGYMVAGLANDSNVGVTPIYWIMLGIGYAAESICRKNDEPSDDATKELPEKSEIISDEDDVLVEDTIFEEL